MGIYAMKTWIKWLSFAGAGTVIVGTFLFGSPVHIEANSKTLVTERHEALTSGVDHAERHYRSGSVDQRVNVMTIDTGDAHTEIGISLPDPLNRLESTSSQAKRANTFERRTVGAVNASFYETGGTYSRLPANLILHDGALVRQGRLSADDSGYNSVRQAFALLADGRGMIDEYALETSVSMAGDTFDVANIDPNGRQMNELVMFTPRYMLDAPGQSYSRYTTEIVVNGLSVDPKEPFPVNQEITGTIQRVAPFGEENNTEIPNDGIVLAANGGAWAEKLEGLSEGDAVSFTVSTESKWADAKTVIGGGPFLVKDGERHITMDPSSSQARTRAPRTAVGVSSDGSEVFFVTVDGRQSGYSNGMTITELADYMIGLGADRAMNLDGGGSTTFVHQKPGYWYPSLTNRPADGAERAVSTTLQVFDTSPLPAVEGDADRMLDLHETDGLSVHAVNGDASIRSTAGTSLPKYRGENGVELTYDFSNGNGATAAAYVNFEPAVRDSGQAERIGLWVYAEQNEHWLRGTIVDFEGNRMPVDFTENGGLSWRGWKYVEAQVPSSVDGPFSLERMYVAEPSPDSDSSGRLIFTGLDMIYDSSFSVPRFFDVAENHWAIGSISQLSERGVIGGHADGSFQPGGNITREQAAAMIVRDLALPTAAVSGAFEDVSASRPLARDIYAVAEAGIMTGANDRFRPADPLTRAELSAILVRAYGLSGETDERFPDLDESHWAFDNISTLLANGLTSGYPDGTFQPGNAVNRAEFSVFLDRISTP